VLKDYDIHTVAHHSGVTKAAEQNLSFACYYHSVIWLALPADDSVIFYVCWRGEYAWCLTPLSTIFQINRGGKFYWWR
jgi:hypothetical protein